MRWSCSFVARPLFPCLALASAVACGGSKVGESGTEGETETETDASSGGNVTVSPTTTAGTTASTGTSTGTTGGDPCAGETCGGAGVCMVLPDGGAWCDCDPGYDNDGPLTCVPDGSDSATATTTTGVSAESGSSGADTGDTGESSSGGSSACTELLQIPMSAEEATLSGSWMLTMSMLGEGMIASLPMGGTDGSVLWQPDIPCDDTWHVWVRYIDFGGADSYYATLDGMPEPPAVFEGGCDQGGDGWLWNDLNWRDEADPPCTYLMDPWTADWTAGVHDIEFSYRESTAIARIIVTNDPDFMPGPGD
jgi:hypothetical protein